VKRNFVRNLRAALYKVETMGIIPAEKDYRKRYKINSPLEQVIRGRLEWIAQVRGRSFSAYRTLAKRFNQQFPNSALPILPTYAEMAESAVWVIEFFVGEVCEQGTAFFLEGVGLVTADHVLESLPPGEHAVLYRPSEPAKKFKATTSSRRCAIRDLAIVNHNVPSADHLSLSVATSPEHTHDEIIALGFPDYGPGDQLGERRGHIIGRATKHGVKLIEVSAMLPGGLSGGPIVNDRYQVIAIVHRGGNQQHKQLAVEISELLALAVE
jgi:RNA-directed DNA polymerase